MANDQDNYERAINRRHALERMIWAGTGVLWAASDGLSKPLSLLGPAEAASAIAQTKPTIPIIVKDMTSFYWQTVLAGARKAGQDLGVNVPELGAQSESDINGQISILENAVASSPAAVVIAPAHFAALGRPIDQAAKKVKIIGIASVDSKALTSFVATDNVQAGRIAADILAERIQKTYADAEGDVALITSLPGVASLDQRAQGFKEQIAAKYGALNIVAEKLADGQTTTGHNIMADLITAYPELRGVFASNLVMAKGTKQWPRTRRIRRGTRSISSASTRTTSSSSCRRRARSRRSLSRTRSAWVTMGSRPLLPPRRASKFRSISIPAPTSSPRSI
jgi:ABC-type sugar transport system substrate-binding protein